MKTYIYKLLLLFIFSNHCFSQDSKNHILKTKSNLQLAKKSEPNSNQLSSLNCGNECFSDTVTLNTGTDYTDNSELPPGEYEGGWQLISSPNDGVDMPRPSYVLGPQNPWWELEGTQYISPFPNPINWDSFPDPYVFERCFCVCDQSSEVNLDIEAYYDNFLNLGLYDDSGNLIEVLVNYDGPASTSTFTGEPSISNTSYNLTPGTYCLRAGLRNDGSVIMGLAIKASVTGAGLIENGCCRSFSIVTGSVYQDEVGNGVFNYFTDEPIQGLEVQLVDSLGSIVSTTTTDILGYFSFFDVNEGSFKVKLNAVGDYVLTEGNNEYAVNVEMNKVTGNINFGVFGEICLYDSTPPDLSCTSEEIDLAINEDGLAIIGNSYLDFIDASDDCGSVLYSIELDTFMCEQLGLNQTILTVSDASLNSSQCSLIYNIIDLNNENCNLASSLDETIESAINIFPVPTSKSVTIELINNNSRFNLKVYNSHVQLVDQLIINSDSRFIKYDMTRYTPGIYNFIFEEHHSNNILNYRVVKL